MKKTLYVVLAALMMFGICACSSSNASAPAESAAATESASADAAAEQSEGTTTSDKVLTVAMECGYAPYN